MKKINKTPIAAAMSTAVASALAAVAVKAETTAVLIAAAKGVLFIFFMGSPQLIMAIDYYQN